MSKLSDSLFDLLVDNEDKFFTVDEIYSTIKEKPHLYNLKDKMISYWDLMDEVKKLEDEYNNVYTFYKVINNHCLLFTIFSKEEKEVVFNRAKHAKVTHTLVNDYDIFGNKTWCKKYIDTVLDTQKSLYDKVYSELFVPRSLFWYKPARDYIVSKPLKLEHIDMLLEEASKEKDMEVTNLLLNKKLTLLMEHQEYLYSKIDKLEEELEKEKNNNVVYNQKINDMKKKKILDSLEEELSRSRVIQTSQTTFDTISDYFRFFLMLFGGLAFSALIIQLTNQ